MCERCKKYVSFLTNKLVDLSFNESLVVIEKEIKRFREDYTVAEEAMLQRLDTKRINEASGPAEDVGQSLLRMQQLSSLYARLSGKQLDKLIELQPLIKLVQTVMEHRELDNIDQISNEELEKKGSQLLEGVNLSK